MHDLLGHYAQIILILLTGVLLILTLFRVVSIRKRNTEALLHERLIHLENMMQREFHALRKRLDEIQSQLQVHSSDSIKGS
ncbi:hypothetical protein WDW89_18840 [Deltaproteobacteria bacterium TL4]